MAGAAIAALMSDLVGRKIALILADFLLAIGWSIIIFTENSKLALTGLIVTGLAIGFTSMASAMFTSETSPPHIRGRVTSLMGILTSFGLLISYLITNSTVSFYVNKVFHFILQLYTYFFTPIVNFITIF